MDKKVEESTPPVHRKSSRIEKTKHLPKPSPRKRTKVTTSGPRKRRKTLQISSFDLEEEETSSKLVQQDVREAKSSIGRKAWKPKIENLNMKIINDNNFVQLNKYYDLYSSMDRR